MTAFARRMPISLALLAAPWAATVTVPSIAFAGPGYVSDDPYTSGPTRPLDGSPRSGVYGVAPAPAYETPRRGVARQAAPPAAEPYELPPIWSGLYIGAQAGYRWSNTSVPGAGAPDVATATPQGGAHIGYNFQTGDVVLGLEGDLMLGSSPASATRGITTLTVNDTWTSSMRARAGFTFGPALLYGTAGVAIAGQDLTLGTQAAQAHLTDPLVGFVFGGGLEYKFAPQLSARIEGLRTSYRESIVNWAAGAQAVRQDSNVLRAGLSFQFN